VKKSGSGISEKSMERLDQAEIAVMRAQEIVRKLRELPRPNLSKRRIYTIEKLLRETVLFALNGSPVRPVFEIEPDLPPVEIDEGEITQVFQNLTINALQAMPEGGNFFVSARRVSFNADGGGGKPHLQIGFTDQGRGIPRRTWEGSSIPTSRPSWEGVGWDCPLLGPLSAVMGGGSMWPPGGGRGRL